MCLGAGQGTTSSLFGVVTGGEFLAEREKSAHETAQRDVAGSRLLAPQQLDGLNLIFGLLCVPISVYEIAQAD